MDQGGAERVRGVSTRGADRTWPRPDRRCRGRASGHSETAQGLRVIYALRLGGGDAVWVVHAFQKKSKNGIKTPKAEIDLIHERLKRLKEMLR